MSINEFIARRSMQFQNNKDEASFKDEIEKSNNLLKQPHEKAHDYEPRKDLNHPG